MPIATHKLVLIALANFADDEDLAWPKVETLAELVSASPRTVHRALDALESQGLISRSMGLTRGGKGGLRRTNSVYRMLLPETVTRRKTPGGLPALVRRGAGGNRYDVGVTTILPPSET